MTMKFIKLSLIVLVLVLTNPINCIKMTALRPKFTLSTKVVSRGHQLESSLVNTMGIVNGDNVLKIRAGFINSNSLVKQKVLLQIVLTSFNILCWLVPLKNKSIIRDSGVMSIANCFAGGIFLMLSFGHILPESINKMTSLGLNGAETLRYALLGYFIMFTIEKIAFLFSGTDHGHHHHHVDTIDITSQQQTMTDLPLTNDISEIATSKSTTSTWFSSVNSAVLLCCALSVHSFLESASLGLAPDSTSAYMLSACIALHQPAESLALLVAFLKSGMSRNVIMLWLLAYSSSTLLGQTVGQLVTRISTSSFEAVISAITAGTFIYVGATEIVNEEFADDVTARDRIKRYAAYLGGVLLMGAVIWTGEQFESAANKLSV